MALTYGSSQILGAFQSEKDVGDGLVKGGGLAAVVQWPSEPRNACVCGDERGLALLDHPAKCIALLLSILHASRSCPYGATGNGYERSWISYWR